MIEITNDQLRQMLSCVLFTVEQLDDSPIDDLVTLQTIIQLGNLYTDLRPLLEYPNATSTS